MKWYKRFELKEVLKSNFKNGAIYYLWGNPHQLIIKKDGDNNIAIENDNLIFSTPSFDSVEMNKSILLSWYENLLKIEIDKIKDRIEKNVGQKADSYLVSSRLGHGHYSGLCYIESRSIEIHRKVVFYRKEILESVMTHELLHFIEPEHNKDFFGLLKKYCPYYQITDFCLAFKNPDYRYYNYINEVIEKKIEYNSYEEYCNVNNIKKEIL